MNTVIFCVISTKKAESLNLDPYENIYGDRINHLNCRSLWQDKKGRLYRVRELYNGETIRDEIRDLKKRMQTTK